VSDAHHAGAKYRFLLENEAKALLVKYGVAVPHEAVARSADEAAAYAAAIGFPVVLKALSPDVPHKTEAGGVKLGIRDAAAARAGFEEIVASVTRYHPGAAIEGVLVAEQVQIEHELFCGVVRDPQFGPVVAFGLGGIFVEVLRDVSFGVTPLLPIDALEMIRGIRGHAVIAGARGRRPVDERLIAEVLLAVGQLVVDNPDIAELDVNPLAATRDGRLLALDCLIKTTS
jgi:acyl-CoA synthetase (NDP forming)